jgi:hypothetical protein
MREREKAQTLLWQNEIIILKTLARMKKKFFKLTSDDRDISGCISPDLSGAVAWIEGEQDDITEADGDTDYTITVIWLTQEEFEAMGEYEA